MAEKRTEEYDPILYLKKQGEIDEKFGLEIEDRREILGQNLKGRRLCDDDDDDDDDGDDDEDDDENVVIFR